jgi:transposase
MVQFIIYVGMDVHKKAINVAVLIGERVEQWQFANEPKAVRSFVKKLRKLADGAEIVCCYEAGPCGYALKRQLDKLGVRCMVIAPSLIPVKPGERIKTDRRDAHKLAVMLRAGALTEVQPPTEEDEALRDLCRCREAAQKDLGRARHRLIKMLLRRGLVFRDGRHWTQKHWKWLRSIELEHQAERFTLQEYVTVVEQRMERVRVLDAEMSRMAEVEPYREPVGWLRCFRGIDTVAALTFVAELYNFARFPTPRALMAFVGMVPSEQSSSDSVRRGAITKAGNTHARRLGIEVAHHYRHRPAVSGPLRKRRAGQPEAVILIADKAQRRLYQRYCALRRRGVHHNKITVALAREFFGFLWAVMHHRAVPVSPVTDSGKQRSADNPRKVENRRVYTMRRPRKATSR